MYYAITQGVSIRVYRLILHLAVYRQNLTHIILTEFAIFLILA